MQKILVVLVTATAAVAAQAAAQPPGPLPVVQRGTPAAASLPAIGPSNADWMAAHFINVGQGASTLLEFSCGLVLIDTGGQESDGVDWPGRLVGYLDKVFARRTDRPRTIDLLVLTHPHTDHTLGVDAILRPQNKLALGQVVTNAQPNGSGIQGQRTLLQWAQKNRRPTVQVTSSLLPAAGGLTNGTVDPLRCNGDAPDIQVLWGSVEGTQAWRSNGNNHSVVVRIDYGQSSFLITGDLAEGALPSFIRRYDGTPTLDVDVYSPGHHGARDGTTSALVRAMTPELAVIGAGNPSQTGIEHSAWEYGHPNRMTIARLTAQPHGITLARPSRRVAVGVSGRAFGSDIEPVFEFQQMTRAIFATGWDGDVVVFANRSGEKRVLID